MPEGDSTSPRIDSFAALRYKDFRSYVGMRFCFTFAYQMQAVIIGFYIYHLTKDPFKLGLVGLCEAIPAVGAALYGGYIADKSEKRKMLLWVFVGVFFSSLVMFLITLKDADKYIDVNWIVPVIYLMIFCNGVARAFYGPATFVIYTQSVPKEIYPNAATWSSSSWQIASILGPAAGGLIYGYLGITVTFVAILTFLLISLVLVYLLRSYPPVFVPKESIGKSLSEGIRFVFNSKMMVGAMSLDLFSVFFGGAVALLPVFANEILKVGPEGLGIMRATSSAGAVLTMLAMARFSPMGKPWRNLLIAVAGFGLSIIGFGFSKSFYLSLFFLFTEGAFDSVSVIIRGTIMQLLTPDHMRGRVSAVNAMFIGSSNEIGAFESGTAARLLGTVPAVIFGGSMTLLIVSITYLKTKVLIPLSLSQIHAPEVPKETV
ncbi:MFS transporter [Mucilaginibacter psychrotolerans]|uniref:MFS transporter n=1 Tax=Mucilaginibacter psychrotolerans TaxID=1524096 RepID=A0A4Y8S841_9SPHI|nr:MFS transporter [Mucilaginibacter psychrotolerans]TFF34811.1 MFS transporter [Mucilaginibacter psychrotolerans]